MCERSSGFALAGDGTRIAWRTAGSSNQVPVLLVMGLGASADAWEHHVSRWHESSYCILPDNRGAGASDAPVGPYSTAQMADDCIAVLDAVDVTSVAVVGISMGGAIAQQLALRHPDRVSSLVLTASWAGPDPTGRDAFTELKELRAVLSPASFLRRLQMLIWSDQYRRTHAAELESERLNAAFGTPEHAFIAQAEACLTHDMRELLGAISARTLITAGADDIFTPLPAAKELHQGIAGSDLVVFERAAHAHHWEQLDRYNLTCEEFIHA